MPNCAAAPAHISLNFEHPTVHKTYLKKYLYFIPTIERLFAPLGILLGTHHLGRIGGVVDVNCGLGATQQSAIDILLEVVFQSAGDSALFGLGTTHAGALGLPILTLPLTQEHLALKPLYGGVECSHNLLVDDLVFGNHTLGTQLGITLHQVGCCGRKLYPHFSITNHIDTHIVVVLYA
jgi:hypothetical protein